MLALAIAGAVWPAVPTLAAAALAWVALALLWPGVERWQRVQSLAFIATGLAAMGGAAGHGAPPRVEGLLGQNQPILSMLASVTLLRLLNPPPRAGEPELPQGRRAYVQSMLGVQALGAVINISAVILIADRLARTRRLAFDQAQLISRAFSAVAFYSPFIGGVALALASTPGSSALVMAAFGLPLAGVACLLLYWQARSGRFPDVDRFRGYPVTLDGLRVPVALGAAVLAAAATTSRYSVLALITMLTPLLVALVLLRRGGLRNLRDGLADYVFVRAPQMGTELALFLSAGVMAAGLIAASASAGGWTLFARLDAFHASLLLLAFFVTSLVGIHPVVIVGVAAPLAGTIDADPTLLATAFAMGWGLGCAVNPMSGINMVLSSRYGVDNWRVARGNVAFSAALYCVAVGLLYLFQYTRL
ncbi:MAG: hypothetical protein OXF93_04430 [Acidobacteria bacterium]|nr:hypothetical protein [Acidobacteriota bacterium]